MTSNAGIVWDGRGTDHLVHHRIHLAQWERTALAMLDNENLTEQQKLGAQDFLDAVRRAR